MAQQEEITILNTQKILVTISPLVDIDGERAEIDGDAVESVTEGDVTVQELDPQDPFKFYIVSGNTVGDSRVHVKADADLSAGTREITMDILVHVTAPEANVLGATFGTPEPK